MMRRDIAITGDSVKATFYTISTCMDQDMYLASIEKLDNDSYALHLDIHGQSGGKRDITLKELTQFVNAVIRSAEYKAIASKIIIIHIGGDFNFDLTSCANADDVNEAKRIEDNRVKLEETICKAFPLGWNVQAYYLDEIVTKRRLNNLLANAQYYKPNARKQNKSDGMGAFLLIKQEKSLTQKATVFNGAEAKPLTQNTKQFNWKISTTKNPHESTLDHGPLIVVYNNRAIIYANIIACEGFVGIKLPILGIDVDQQKLLADALEKKINSAALKMIKQLDPAYYEKLEKELKASEEKDALQSSFILEWTFQPQCHSNDDIEELKKPIKEFYTEVLTSQEYQNITCKLISPSGNDSFGLEEFNPNVKWQALAPYVADKSDFEEHLKRYMHNACSSMIRQDPCNHRDPTAYTSFSINHLTNTLLTTLGQQIAGGFPVSEDLAEQLNRKDADILEIYKNIRGAQKSELDSIIEQLRSSGITHIIVVGIEVKYNLLYNSGMFPNFDIPQLKIYATSNNSGQTLFTDSSSSSPKNATQPELSQKLSQSNSDKETSKQLSFTN